MHRYWSALLGLIVVAALGLEGYRVEYALAEMRSGGTVAVSSAPWLAWIEILLFFLFSGAFGGILNLVLPYAATRGGKPIESPGSDRSGEASRSFPPPTTWEFLVSTLGGVGGAIAGLGVMLLDNKIKPGFPDEIDCLRFICVGMVSGFLGFRLLQPLAEHLLKMMENKMIKMDKEIQKTSSEVKKVREEGKQNREEVSQDAKEVRLNALKAKAREALEFANAGNYTSIPDAISQIEAALSEFRGERELAIYRGRLYRKAGDHLKPDVGEQNQKYSDAVKALDEALEAIELDHPPRNADKAAVLYNRACYTLLRWKLAPEGEGRTVLRQKALNDLKTAYVFDPPLYLYAEGDEDLNDIRNDPDFRALKPQDPPAPV